MVFQYRGVKYRCTMGKFPVHLLIVVLVLAIMISRVSNITGANAPKRTVTVIVHHGDTLWSLAKRFGPGADPRLVINAIKSQNNLSGSELIAGQKLKLTIGRD